jgi:hypothetical protein
MLYVLLFYLGGEPIFGPVWSTWASRTPVCLFPLIDTYIVFISLYKNFTGPMDQNTQSPAVISSPIVQ